MISNKLTKTFISQPSLASFLCMYLVLACVCACVCVCAHISFPCKYACECTYYLSWVNTLGMHCLFFFLNLNTSWWNMVYLSSETSISCFWLYYAHGWFLMWWNILQLSTIWAETADNARSAARSFVLGGLSEKHYGLSNFWVTDRLNVQWTFPSDFSIFY